MEQYEYEKYVCSKDTLKETIDKYGVAIIPSVIDAEECLKMRAGMWQSIEKITENFDVPIKQNDSSTWSSFPQLYPLHSMLLQRYGLAHAQYYWDLRQNENIVDVFATLWNVANDELLVSFDGLSLHLPPEETGRGYFRNNTWLHCDQSPTRNGFECVQSFLTANEIRAGDATLSFLEGSNRLHGEFAAKFNITEKGDWYKLNETEQKFFLDNGCERKCIMCPAGSLVLFDSRTQHQGIESLKSRPIQNERCIIYLCYTPRERATAANLKKKIKAFEERRTTSHWPHKPMLFPINPRTYGGALPDIAEIDPPVLNDLGRRLVGYLV